MPELVLHALRRGSANRGSKNASETLEMQRDSD